MELLLVSLIIILATFLNSFSYFVGLMKTASGMVFLGTVHYPLDYFYYLSQIIQGQTGWFGSYHLQTGEFGEKVLLGWSYVFFGRIASFFSLPPIITYQIMVVLFSILFLTSSYLFIHAVFPDSVKKRLIAFILFVTSNGFPKIVSVQGKWTLSFYDSWNNYGFPFVRLGNVPHHLLVHSLIIFTLLAIVSILSKKNYSPLAMLLFLFLGLTLGSLQPAQWGLLVLTISISTILYVILVRSEATHPESQRYPGQDGLPAGTRQARMTMELRFHMLLPYLLSLAIFFLAGLPFFIYLKKLFEHLPFSQALAWESTQHLYLPFKTFILIHGPLAILTIIGLPLFLLRKGVMRVYIKNFAGSLAFRARPQCLSRDHEVDEASLGGAQKSQGDLSKIPAYHKIRLVITIYTLLSLGLFFSPLPQKLGVLNTRFLSVVYVLLFACVATDLITCLPLSKKINTLLQSVLVLMIVLLTVPVSWLQLKNRFSFDPHNAYYYLPKDALVAFQEGRKISTPNDVFLVLWPFEVSFSGLTGRRVYLSNFIATSNFGEKATLANKFFESKMSEEEAKRFLRESSIKYVLVYPWTFPASPSFLEQVYQNNFLMIYKVSQ